MDKKRITIEIRTVIDRQGDKEMSISKQSGEYIRKKDVEIIKFIENREDIGAVDHYISIQPHKVMLKRTGSISMSHLFETGKKSETIYRHPYGSLHIEIKTISLVRKLMNKNQAGEVIIAYDSLINGVEEQQHHLTLTYMEEKK